MTCRKCQTDDQTLDDASLLAAAPELLEACRALVNAIDPQMPPRKGRKPKFIQPPMEEYYVEPLRIAREAIEKAEGRK